MEMEAFSQSGMTASMSFILMNVGLFPMGAISSNWLLVSCAEAEQWWQSE